MDNDILPALLLSGNLYMIVSISTMILANIGVVLAVSFLCLKHKFRRMTPLDYLTTNLLVGCGMFSISNFVAYSYDLFNKPTPANACIFVQTVQGILWYNEFMTIMIIIVERTYSYVSPVNQIKKFKPLTVLLMITGTWLVAAGLGVLSSFPYNWSKIQLKTSLELCHCESLIFKKMDIGVQVCSLLIPYTLMLLTFPIARISALKDDINVQKDAGLSLLDKYYATSNIDSRYSVKKEFRLRQKVFYWFLLITYTLKILVFLLKEFNNYQNVVAFSTHPDEAFSENTPIPYNFPTTVIGLLNLLFLLGPIYNLICCILINKSFFKNSFHY